MINIDIDPVAYVLLFVTLMTIVLLVILVFIIRQQMYMKRLYERVGPEMVAVKHSPPPSPPSAEIPAPPSGEDLSSYDAEAIAAEAAAKLREEVLIKEKEDERRRLEEERGKDPAEYYQSDSIRDNLLALFERYKLNSFTMSTSDGLVISSTDPNPEEEAAKYSYLYQQEKQPDVPNIRLIGVPYKGGTVVGIVKADDELSEKELEFIERDINFILRKTV
ncbi:MAG: hypothetical protein JW931_00970 [Methanomicrobiaceae archaeon]|nr:hypothetical protein [Methanomicrobiaceae archaeon]